MKIYNIYLFDKKKTNFILFCYKCSARSLVHFNVLYYILSESEVNMYFCISSLSN